MSSFILKIIAIICMFCDHFGDFYYNSTTILNYIGRFAFTIFAFQISEGYIHTHNIRKYITRLFLFACISQIPFMLFYYSIFDTYFAINVIFTLLFGLLTVLIYDKYNKILGVITGIMLGILAQLCHFDYGFYGVFIVFIFYILRNHKLYMSLLFIISVIIKYYANTIKFQLPISYIFWGNKFSLLMYSTCFSIIPILFYNGKKGKDAKYLFYIFYPLHLLILGMLRSMGTGFFDR